MIKFQYVLFKQGETDRDTLEKTGCPLELPEDL